MKRLTAAITVCLVLSCMLIPAVLVADQLPVPMEKSVFPGVTTIQYAGQTLVFTTSSMLKVTFRANTANEIEVSVKTATARSTNPYSTTGEVTDQLVINWKNFNEDIYNGQPPSQPWTGVLNTEGGWTEK